MDAPPAVRDAQERERSERHRLVGLLVVFLLDAIVSAWFASQEAANRLYTIESGPTYVPTWLDQYWQYYGFSAGVLFTLGVWTFSQLSRWGTARRAARAAEAQAVRDLASVPPPPDGAGSATENDRAVVDPAELPAT